VTVASVDAVPDAALSAATERQAVVDRLLDDEGVASTQRRTVGATVRVEWGWELERRVRRGYRATAATQVRLGDPAAVGPILRRAIAEADAEVAGPWWRVLPTNPGTAEACRLAAADARAKADAYAAALGVRVGRVVEAAEPVTKPGPAPFAERGVAVAMMRESPQDEGIDVTGGELDVQATLDVTFDLLDD
jgi:uncharacterized protein YggE